jgi:hypothetical protein
LQADNISSKAHIPKTVELDLQHYAGHSKLHAMNTRPTFPMVLITMAMRMMRMEMFCRAEWKAR